MQLGTLAAAVNSAPDEDGKSIDFASAGLYLPAAQAILATTTSSVVSVLACWLVPVRAISAVRTLALTATVGLAIVKAPIRVGNAKGVNTIFSALRPCSAIYMFGLILEQLVHTCTPTVTSYEQGMWRRVIYHTCMAALTVAAFLRARSPRSENDLPFLVSCVAMLIVAILPPPAVAQSGPLCSPPTLMAAGERVVRAFLFSCVYVVLVYCSAPISNALPDAIVCIARSAAASAWVLGSHIMTLPLAVLQIGVLLYCSFVHSDSEYDAVGSDIEDAKTAGDAMSPCVSRHDAALGVLPPQDETALAIATSKSAAHPPPAGLKFALSLANCSCTPSVPITESRFAEIAANYSI